MTYLRVLIIDEKYDQRVHEGIDEFIRLRDIVSEGWRSPSVLEEFGRSWDCRL